MSLPLLENLIPKTGWMSLVEGKSICEEDTISEIYKTYVQRQRKGFLQAQNDYMDDTLRDLYMKYVLLSENSGIKKDLVKQKTQHIARYIHCIGGYPLLLEQVNALFRSGFDPFWQVTCVASLTGALKHPDLSKHKELFAQKKKYPLLCYRTIHHYNARIALEKNIDLNRQRSDALRFFDSRSSSYHKKTHYYVLLQFHHDLVQVIPKYMDLFYKIDSRISDSSSSKSSMEASRAAQCSSIRSSPAVSISREPKILQKQCLSGATPQKGSSFKPVKNSLGKIFNAQAFSELLLTRKSKKILAILDEIKQCHRKKYFPKLIAPKKVSFSAFSCSFDLAKISRHQKNADPLFSEKIVFTWGRMKHDLSGIKPLKCPPTERLYQEVARQLRKKYDTSIEGDQKQLIANQCKLAQALYKTPMKASTFHHILNVSFRNSIKLISKKNVRPHHNSWSIFFDPKTPPDAVSGVIYEIENDLTKLCSLLYKNLATHEIEKKLAILSKRSDRSRNDPGKKDLSQLYNDVGAVIAFHIIKAESKDRCVIFKRAVDLALEALKPPVVNLHICFAIIAALQIKAVELCEIEQGSLSESTFNRLKTGFDPSKMVEKMDQFEIVSEFPVIPYYGYIKRKFLLAIEQSSDEVVSLCNRISRLKAVLQRLDFGKNRSADAAHQFVQYAKQIIEAKPAFKIEFIQKSQNKETLSQEEWKRMPWNEKLYYFATDQLVRSAR